VSASPLRWLGVEEALGPGRALLHLLTERGVVLVSGERVIVRGEVTGTPAGDLFGAPHTGKSFRIMAIDIQTIRDGKIARTYHLENWLSALGQLRAK